MQGEGEEQKDACLKTLPPNPPPLGTSLFPIKSKDGGPNFLLENTKLLLTKITPAPQDSVVKEYMRPH